MGLNEFFQIWRKLLEVKKSKTVQKAVSDFLSIELIEVETDFETAKRTKDSAQKILGMMFASLRKKGRPSQKFDEEVNYGI